jgi:hypothetical protein
MNQKKFHYSDISLIIGIGLLSYGLFLIKPEICYIVIGTFLIMCKMIGFWFKTKI